jgi:hypothetical protein
MTRDKYLEALLPGVRESIVHFVGAERERRARAMLEQYTTNELAIMYSKQVAARAIKPPTPAVTHAEVEKGERIKGERERQKLRDQHEMNQALDAEARIMEVEKFRKQQFEQQAPQRAAQLAEDKQTFIKAYNRLRSFTNNEANWNLVISTLGSGFSVYDLEQAILSNAIQLSKPTQDEHDNWTRQDVAHRNAELKAMDIPTLKKELLREQTANRVAATQREENGMLEEMRLRDLQMNLPPLPTHDQNGHVIDATYLKRLCNTDLPKYKHWLRRFGGYALTLRLQGRA